MRRPSYHHHQIHRRFLDRYGCTITILILAALFWYLIDRDLHRTPELFLLFPLHWLAIIPYGEYILDPLKHFMVEPWWIWVDVASATIVWTVVFFVVRGVYYSFTNLSGFFVIAISIIFLVLISFAYWVLLPTFDQIHSWWGEWDGQQIEYVE